MDDCDGSNKPSEFVLVKYNIPVLVSSHTDKSIGRNVASTSSSSSATAAAVAATGPTINEATVSVSSAKDRSARPSSTNTLAESRRETEEILNSILPPRTWEEDGQLWMQTVSSVPATRQDVVNLQETLDSLLHQSQARETGICPIRRELYTQCFDELIRQVTINCTERGLLLLRVRDEMVMSMDAYEALYCSSIAFGLRKALQSQEGKEKLVEYVAQLERDKETMENVISDMRLRAEQNERRNAELRAAEEKKHAEEIAFLKKTNAQLKTQLEGIIAPKK